MESYRRRASGNRNILCIASPIVKMAGGKSLEDAQNKVAEMKAEAKGQSEPVVLNRSEAVRKIIFACDAGMGLLPWELPNSETV